jgi:hypothetical protein
MKYEGEWSYWKDGYAYLLEQMQPKSHQEKFDAAMVALSVLRGRRSERDSRAKAPSGLPGRRRRGHLGSCARGLSDRSGGTAIPSELGSDQRLRQGLEIRESTAARVGSASTGRFPIDAGAFDEGGASAPALALAL